MGTDQTFFGQMPLERIHARLAMMNNDGARTSAPTPSRPYLPVQSKRGETCVRECATTCLPRQQAPSARPPSVRATMAVGTAQRVSLRALRAAKAAHGVGSAPPDMRVAVVSARLPHARSSPARGRTALRLPPGGASYGSVNCAARLPAPSERAAALVPRTPRAARRNLPPRAAAADDLGSHTISVRVRLSGAAGPAGDLVLSGVAPGSTTARALVARWAGLGAEGAPPALGAPGAHRRARGGETWRAGLRRLAARGGTHARRNGRGGQLLVHGHMCCLRFGTPLLSLKLLWPLCVCPVHAGQVGVLTAWGQC